MKKSSKAQKPQIIVRDLKPRKDAKGGLGSVKGSGSITAPLSVQHVPK